METNLWNEYLKFLVCVMSVIIILFQTLQSSKVLYMIGGEGQMKKLLYWFFNWKLANFVRGKIK